MAKNIKGSYVKKDYLSGIKATFAFIGLLIVIIPLSFAQALYDQQNE